MSQGIRIPVFGQVCDADTMALQRKGIEDQVRMEIYTSAATTSMLDEQLHFSVLEGYQS